MMPYFLTNHLHIFYVFASLQQQTIFIEPIDSMQSRKLCLTLGALNSFSSDQLFKPKVEQPLKNAMQMPTEEQCKQRSVFQNKPISSQESYPKQQNKNFPKKLKPIHKILKGREANKDKGKQGKQMKIFKYFTKKIFTQETYTSTFKTTEIVRIYDWLMEACSHLSLSKNSYYSTISMAQNIFSHHKNTGLSHHSIQTLSASMVSLAAKFQSNTLNYPQAISMMFNLNKEQIIEGEIFIMKSLQFNLPVVHLNQKIIEILVNWFKFLNKNQDSIRLDKDTLTLGQNNNPSTWPNSHQNRYNNIIHIFDIILVKFHHYFPITQNKSIIQGLTFSMFVWLNYECNQFFPTCPNDLTYLVTLFQLFLNNVYAYQLTQFSQWMKFLIRIRNELNIIENVYRNMGGSVTKINGSGSQSSNTNDCASESKCMQFFGQKYHCIWSWN